MNRLLTVTCPTCRASVNWTAGNPWRPFCSARCKGIDLGDWASDRFVIAGESLGAFDDETGAAGAPRQ